MAYDITEDLLPQRAGISEDLVNGVSIPPLPELFEPDHQFAVENEHAEQQLRPLKKVKFDYSHAPGASYARREEWVDEMNGLVNQQLEDDFAYYSDTMELETDTDRVYTLQEIADRMLEGTDQTARIVIMNKGWRPNGFVTPDGTVFISQSLLNRLDTLDEVGAIIAHELNHLINETVAIKEVAPDILMRLASGWVHEIAADVETIKLMEKARLNTRAFESAIQKVSPTDLRGVEHGTSLSRAVEGAGVHYARDSASSHILETPLESEIKSGRRFKPTNAELAHVVVNGFMRDPERYDLSKLKRAIPRVHARDILLLLEVAAPTGKEGPEAGQIRDKQKDFITTVSDNLSHRLEDVGLTPMEEKIFMLGLENHEGLRYIVMPRLEPRSRPLLHRSDDPAAKDYFPDENALNAAVAALPAYFASGDHGRIFRQVFGTSVRMGYHSASVVCDLAEYFSRHPMISPQASSGSSELVGSETVLNMLRVLINARHDLYNRHDNVVARRLGMTQEAYNFSVQHLNENIYGIMLDYAEKAFLSLDEGGFSVDQEQARNFFTAAKEDGIQLRSKDVENLQYLYERFKEMDDPITELYEIMADVFGVSLEIERPEFLDVLGVIEKEIKGKFANPEHKDYGNIKIFAEAIEDIVLKNGREKKDHGELFKQVCEVLDNFDYHTQDNPRNVFDNGRRHSASAEWSEIDTKLVRYTLKLIAAGNLFKENPAEYLKQVRMVMEATAIDVSSLSFYQQLNLIFPLFGAGSGGRGAGTSFQYKDYHDFLAYGSKMRIPPDYHQQLIALPYVRPVLESVANWQVPNTMGDFLKHLGEFHKRYLGMGVSTEFGRSGLFEQNLENLLIGWPLRKQLINILSEPVPISEYQTLHRLLDLCLPRLSDKQRMIRRLHLSYLGSSEVSLEDKVEYLLKNYEAIGPGGMELIAENISSYSDYLFFREKMGDKIHSYVSEPSMATAAGMLVDFFGSYLNRKFEDVFSTANLDPKNVLDVNTRMVRAWAKECIRTPVYGGYDPYWFNTRTRMIATKSGQPLPTPQDVVDRVQLLPESVDYYIALKMLTDRGGALSSTENRQQLARLVNEAIGLSPGFVSDVLDTLVTEGDSKLLGLFITKMLGPLLFRNLDPAKADYDEILANEEYVRAAIKDPEELKSLASAHGWEICIPEEFTKDPDSWIYQQARALIVDNHQIFEQLDTVVLPEKTTASEEDFRDPELDPAIDSVIGGVEFSSSMGRRSLQLSRQMRTFKPPVARRLDKTLDSQHGMSKLVFWENFHLQIERDPSLAEFVQTRNVLISGYAGGGSLFTTYYSQYTDPETGQIIDSVCRQLNPNAISILEENHQAAQEIIGVLKQKFGDEWRREIETMELLLDLSYTWSIKDIMDPTFMEDDANFRKTLADIGPKMEAEFYAPQVDFYSQKIRFERRAYGRTANKILADPNVPNSLKKSIVGQISGFVQAQFSTPVMYEGEQGKKYRLGLSDPHLGNFVIDILGDKFRVGLVDRNMFLRLYDQDVRLAYTLMYESNRLKFLNQFVDRIMDTNQIRGVGQRLAIKGKVMAAVGEQARASYIKGEEDKFALIQAALSSLSNTEAPNLDLMLLTRNVTHWDQLLTHYGMSWRTVSGNN